MSSRLRAAHSTGRSARGPGAWPPRRPPTSRFHRVLAPSERMRRAAPGTLRARQSEPTGSSAAGRLGQLAKGRPSTSGRQQSVPAQAPAPRGEQRLQRLVRNLWRERPHHVPATNHASPSASQALKEPAPRPRRSTPGGPWRPALESFEPARPTTPPRAPRAAGTRRRTSGSGCASPWPGGRRHNPPRSSFPTRRRAHATAARAVSSVCAMALRAISLTCSAALGPIGSTRTPASGDGERGLHADPLPVIAQARAATRSESEETSAPVQQREPGQLPRLPCGALAKRAQKASRGAREGGASGGDRGAKPAGDERGHCIHRDPRPSPAEGGAPRSGACSSSGHAFSHGAAYCRSIDSAAGAQARPPAAPARSNPLQPGATCARRHVLQGHLASAARRARTARGLEARQAGQRTSAPRRGHSRGWQRSLLLNPTPGSENWEH